MNVPFALRVGRALEAPTECRDFHLFQFGPAR